MNDPMDIGQLVAEVARGNFSDARLNKRLAGLVGGLAKSPKRGLPRCFDSAGLEAAYRFFSNQRVTPMALLAGHFEATRQRCAEHEVVLVAHDTTSFSYRYDGEREGLGRVQRGNEMSSQTFFAHLSLTMTADGMRRPLGIAGFKTWVREEAPSGTEYQRWEDQIRAVCDQLGGLKHAIHLADREGDDYEMFSALKRDGHRFVVRCQHNRLLEVPSEKLKLHEHFSGIPSVVEREVPLNRRTPKENARKRKTHPARAARTARLSVAAATVELRRPLSPRKHARTDAPASLLINVVRVWEAEPPEGAEPVEWYLYTTEPIETAQQQLAVVDYYRARWTIEEYNKAIKTGCEFEKRQLQDYEALVNLLAVFVPIAYRLLLIRNEARRTPEPPALSVVSQDELDVLRALGRRKLPDAPTARDVYLAIAALGGHIKYAPDPGWLTLARGFEDLQTLTTGWIAAKLQLASDQR
jgi:hypothetical protein